MKFEFKGQEYTFPAALSEITLGQRVSFYQIHGKELEALAKEAADAKDDFLKELAITIFNTEMAVREFAHYSGIPLEQVRNEIDIESLMSIYAIDMQLLREQESEIEAEQEYEWRGETWTLSAPELSTSNKMTLNEFLHAKEAVRQLHKLGNGKWDSLPYLCAVYLRKKDEPFTEDMVAEGSERMKLMQELPLDIALGVAFFLSGTLRIYRTTLASSTEEEVKAPAQQATSTTGDGSAS